MAGASMRPRPGGLGRRSFDFSLAAGLSLSARRQIGSVSPGLDTGGLPVAPPAEWDDAHLDSIEVPRTGDATLDHIILTQMRAKAASQRRAPARGLRSALRRAGTRMGRDTGPGASARRLRPQTAPMSRDLEIQRLVSGDGGDTRPRAPRSGPAVGGGPRRAPGSHPGQEARGRFGRPAPWLDHRGAQGSAPAPMSGRSASAAASLGTGPVDGPSRDHAGTTPREPVRRDPFGSEPVPVAPTSSLPTRPDVVAGIAASIPGIGGLDRGSSGLHLARSSAGLPGLLQAPRSSAASAATGAAAAMARLAASTARVAGDAPVGAPAMVRSGGGGASPDPRHLATSASGAALPSPRASSTRPRPGRGTADADGTASPPSAAGSIPSGRPTRGDGEPALAAALRATPPALSLASPPRRSFDPVPSPVMGRASAPPWHDRGRRHAEGASPLASGGPGVSAAAGTAGLPVAGHITAGASSTSPSGSSNGFLPAAPPRPARDPARLAATPGVRGLGSVASLASPPEGNGTPRPASVRPATDGDPERPFETGARRALRSLPDLATFTSPSVGRTSLRGVSPELLATMAPPVPAGAAPGRGSSYAPSAPGATSPISSSGTSARPGVDRAAPPAPQPLPTPDLPVAPPATVPADPGERFTQTVERHGGAKPRPLPQRFEPIARAILPRPDRVRIAVDPASRAALTEAGKVAATAGDVVHLSRPLDATPASLDILAHELTHVAHPSPLVRFFDDDRHSKEESLAREIGQVMAKAPVGSPPATPPPAPPPAGGASASSSSAGSHRAPPAAPPLPRLGGGGRAGGGRQSSIAAASPPGLIDPTPDRGGGAGSGRSPDTGATLAAAGIDIDRLLDALEARVIRELERRGRRWPRPI
jgi:hypothetical protein